MAVAKNTSEESRLASLEKAAISYFDDFIDTRDLPKGSAGRVPLVSFQGWVGSTGPKGVRDYIGYGSKEIEDFIKHRSHLWQILASKNADANKMMVVEKQPQQLRAALVSILTYVEGKSKDGGKGASLNSISIQIGQHFPRVKAELGKGLNGVKSFLLHFPNLFAVQLYDPKNFELENIIFKNLASVVNGVILLPKQIDQRSPTHLDGCGPVIRMYQKFGFVRDLHTNEEAFFIPSVFQGTLDTFKQMTTNSEDFRFEALYNADYDTGKTTNKWFVIHMWPKDEPKKEAASAKAALEATKAAAEATKSTADAAKPGADAAKSTADAAKSTADAAKSGADAARSTTSAVKSTTNAAKTAPTAANKSKEAGKLAGTKSTSSSSSSTSKDGKKAPADPQKTSKVSNEAKEKPTATKKPISDKKNDGEKKVDNSSVRKQQSNLGPSSMVDMIKALNDELEDDDSVSASEDQKNLDVSKADDVDSYLKRLEKLEQFTMALQRQSELQGVYGKLAASSGPTSSPTRPTYVAQSPTFHSPSPKHQSHSKPTFHSPSPVPTPFIVASASPSPASSSITSRTSAERMTSPADASKTIGQSAHFSRPEVVRKLVHTRTRDVGCQTEFNDERELLLRILRRSPDLLKLVKVFRQTTVMDS